MLSLSWWQTSWNMTRDHALKRQSSFSSIRETYTISGKVFLWLIMKSIFSWSFVSFQNFIVTHNWTHSPYPPALTRGLFGFSVQVVWSDSSRHSCTLPASCTLLVLWWEFVWFCVHTKSCFNPKWIFPFLLPFLPAWQAALLQAGTIKGSGVKYFIILLVYLFDDVYVYICFLNLSSESTEKIFLFLMSLIWSNFLKINLFLFLALLIFLQEVCMVGFPFRRELL